MDDVGAADGDTGFVPMPQEPPTASIGRRPVPQADVGGPVVRRQTSILDVIMGN